MIGKIVSVHEKLGYGFIRVANSDVFFTRRALLDGVRLPDLSVGDVVEFQITPDDGRTKLRAINIRLRV